MSRPLLHTAIAFLLLVSPAIGQVPATNPGSEPGKPVRGLLLTLDKASGDMIELTFQNVSKKNMILNLGGMGGQDLIPSRIQLIVTDAAGKSRELIFKNQILRAFAKRV